MPESDPFLTAATVLAAAEGSFAWLDAGPRARSGQSYLVVPGAREHRIVANVATNRVTEQRAGVRTEFSGDIFSVLAERWNPEPLSERNSAGFDGGWIGWFGYECAQATLGVAMQTESARYPDAAWFTAGAWARFDHASGELSVAGPDQAACARLQAALDAPDPAPTPEPTGSAVASWRDDSAQYAERVRSAQRLIRDGECYQICFTSRLSGTDRVDPIGVYRRLRAAAPSHHGSLIRIGDTALASVSPEQFLELTPAGQLSSKPIKGTRPRSPEPGLDQTLAEELLASEKERAENVMIVDLMRNDLGKVALTGTVSVPSLLTIESYAPVHQLVSTVRVQFDPSRHPIDAVTAAFPAGSMTGAPKHRAVQRLQELETGPRGIYSGAHGYLSNDGSIDLAMTIRTIVIRPDGWSVGAGGGITALSEPEDEVAEARLKAAAMRSVLQAENAK